MARNQFKIEQTTPDLFPRLAQYIDGSFYDGSGNLIEIGSGSNRYFVQEPPAPTDAIVGDRWYDLSTATEFVYFSDGDSFQWVTPFISRGSGFLEFYYQSVQPTASTLGARWIDSVSNTEYIWVYDGLNYRWMQPNKSLSTTFISASQSNLTFYYEYYGVGYTDGICTLTLPYGVSPKDDGKQINISDEVGGISNGNRGILVQGTASQLIQGQSSILMKIDRMSLNFLFRNSSWKLI